MKILYKSQKVEKQCQSLSAAKRLFGGDNRLALSLQAHINSLCQASTIKDIIVQKNLNFHSLHGKMKGCFAIDVLTHDNPWRIILVPLNEAEEEFDPCNIDEIASIVKIVEVKEVSHHYE